MQPVNRLEYLKAGEDRDFDQIFPQSLRELSILHWTPVKIARRAAEFLVTAPGTRVLDIGCGPGKFCIVGAVTTAGSFEGIEQRLDLCRVGQAAIQRAGIKNAQIVHGNVTSLDFQAFQAFYLFNPFEEHLQTTSPIDSTIELSESLYEGYTHHVAEQLARAPVGTRVATFYGKCEEIPPGYHQLGATGHSALKFWEKRDGP
ncbi:MAG: class I SAM-dependent methyltransferase [Verrucomicrobiales bacterium]|nr:class I SAM-dependent methyltransferase [Verrucomicrobiales bacterium]